MSKDLRLLHITQDYFRCDLCKNIVQVPVECLECERLFCFKCLEQFTRDYEEMCCPSNCSEPVFEKAGHAFEKLMGFIYSSCRSPECTHSESIKTLSSHEKRCNFKCPKMEIELDDAVLQRDYFWIQVLNRVLTPTGQNPLHSCTGKTQQCFNF